MNTYRTDAVDEIAHVLPQRVALVTRLMVRQADLGLSRSEVGVLATLAEGPRRITELADLEGLAQPTVTLLVKRLEERAWVRRERDAADGRAVRVVITEAGRTARARLHEQVAAMLHARLAGLPDADLEALRAAADALDPLINALQHESS